MLHKVFSDICGTYLVPYIATTIFLTIFIILNYFSRNGNALLSLAYCFMYRPHIITSGDFTPS